MIDIQTTLDQIFDAIVLEKVFSYKTALSMCSDVASELTKRFGKFLDGISFCVEVGEDRFFFEYTAPAVLEYCESAREQLRLCLNYKDKIYRVVTLRYGDDFALFTRRAVRAFVSDFFSWESPYKEALLAPFKGKEFTDIKPLEDWSTALGLHYEWSLVSYTNQPAYYQAKSNALPMLDVITSEMDLYTAAENILIENNQRVIKHFLLEE